MRPASQNNAITLRAFLALFLPVAFYGMAVVVIGALLYLSYLEFRIGDLFYRYLWLGYLGGAGLALWLILPRRYQFKARGIGLFVEQQPRLFAIIQEVAAQTGQTLPNEVYLVADVNAWLIEYGGFWGFGSRRALGIGLALLQVLTVDQLRGVLAHEFGHFHQRESKLGPWVYRTRLALMRTWIGRKNRSWLQGPFFWYGQFFWHLTQEVSHRQEYVADALAARVAGKQAALAALQKIYGTAPAFDAFVRQQYAPALSGGLQPSFVASFKRYLAAPAIQKTVEATIEQQMQQTAHNHFDLHPPLCKRVAAIRSLPPLHEQLRLLYDDRPAIMLLDNISELEQTLFAHSNPFTTSALAGPIQRPNG